jgi:hypothetical protein
MLPFHGAEKTEVQESSKKSSFPAPLPILHVTTHSSVSMVSEHPPPFLVVVIYKENPILLPDNVTKALACAV